MAGKDVILNLGIGRSGTSALTRVLSLCGCGLPLTVFAPRDENRTGFWEPVEATKLNFEFLIQHGMSLGDPMCLKQELAVDEKEAEDFINHIRAFLRQSPCESPLLIKCGGVLNLLKLWLEAVRREGHTVKIIIPFRHPQEVLASMSVAFGAASVELKSALWLKSNLLAERCSRTLPRVFVEYADLMSDWRNVVCRVSKALSVDLKLNESAVNAFLTPDLYRQRRSGPITEPFGCAWLSRVYKIFSIAAKDGRVNVRALDEIFDAYCANEQAFRIIRDELPSKPIDVQQFRKTFESLPVWRAGNDF